MVNLAAWPALSPRHGLGNYDTKVARVIHQNWNGVRKVTVDDLNLGWHQDSGRMEIWLPWR